MGKTAIPDADDFALATGTCCEIAGLVSAPHTNGKRCTLHSISDGRWKVRLDDGTYLRLKPENVYAVPSRFANGKRCKISGLVSAPQHNGRRCTLINLQNGRWTVGLESGVYVTLKPENLPAAPRPRALRAPILKQGGAGNGGLPLGHAEAPAKKTAAAASKGGAEKRKAAALEESKENEGGENGCGNGAGLKVALAKPWEEGTHDPTDSLMREMLDSMRCVWDGVENATRSRGRVVAWFETSVEPPTSEPPYLSQPLRAVKKVAFF